MVVGEIAEPVDLLVIGGGPGGYTAALHAATLGRSVTLVERAGVDGVGGVCLHVGCIPSKALIELADAAYRLPAMAERGLTVGEVEVNLTRFQEWRRGMVGGLGSGVASRLAQAKVELVRGTARFSRENRVAVERDDGGVSHFEFRHAIIASGTRPVELPGLAFDGARVLDSTGALALEAVPSSVAIVGAGYIGMEIGMALAKLGAAVTVVEALDRILPTIDPALARPVARRAAELGMTLHQSARAAGLDGDDLIVKTADGDVRCPAEKVVVAIGRRPNTDDLGLDHGGLRTTVDGLLQVDERMMCSPTVAAIGDVVAGPALAHKAYAEAKVAAEAVCGLPTAYDPVQIPTVIFTDPEIASVGLDETTARNEGFDVVTGRFPFSGSGRAATLAQAGGYVQVVADREADQIVGVHVVGAHASELIAEGGLALEMAASPYDLAGTIHPHPTLSEAIADAAEALVQRLSDRAMPAAR